MAIFNCYVSSPEGNQKLPQDYHSLPQLNLVKSHRLAKSPWNSSNLRKNLLQVAGLYPPAGSFHALEGSVPSVWQQNKMQKVDSRGISGKRCWFDHKQEMRGSQEFWRWIQEIEVSPIYENSNRGRVVFTNPCWICPRWSNLLDSECCLVDIPRVRTSPRFEILTMAQISQQRHGARVTEHAKTKN